MKLTRYGSMYHDPIDEIILSPWSKRGWTFQENDFSTRKLYFTPPTVAYYCGHEIKLANEESRRFKSVECVTGRLANALERHKKLKGFLLEDMVQANGRLLDSNPHIPSRPSSSHSCIGKTTGGIQARQISCWSLGQGAVQMARLALSRSTRTTSDPGRTASLRYVPKLYSSVLELGFTDAGCEVALEKGDGLPCCEILECSTTPKGLSLNPYGGVASGHLRVTGMARLMSKAELMELFKDIIVVIVGHDQLNLDLDWWDPRMKTGVMREADNAMLGQLVLLNLIRFPRGNAGILLMSTGKQNEYLRVGMFQFRFWGRGYTDSEYSQISEEAKLIERGWEKRTVTII